LDKGSLVNVEDEISPLRAEPQIFCDMEFPDAGLYLGTARVMPPLDPGSVPAFPTRHVPSLGFGAEGPWR
jgi:hypothetical protein